MQQFYILSVCLCVLFENVGFRVVFDAARLIFGWDEIFPGIISSPIRPFAILCVVSMKTFYICFYILSRSVRKGHHDPGY